MSRTGLRKLLPFCLWLLVGLVFASQLHLFASRTGGHMGWRDAFLWEVPRWGLWALFAPLVIGIAHKYPLRRRNAGRIVALHVLCGSIVSLIHLVLFVLIFHGLRLSIAERGSLSDTLQFAFPLDFHVGVAVYFLIILLKQYGESEQRVARLQAELTQAQLQALKMQLHPHFLFNTLNSISSYLRIDVEIADEMIGRLGDFLRLTLQNPGKQEIVLEKELEFLKLYLGIEQLRFQDRLRLEFEIDPDALSVLVPNLILQPLVENAVRHGVAAQPGVGEIRITANRVESELRIQIQDNGAGFSQQITEGIGISTTRDRLRQMYGAEGRLTFANQSGGGAVVNLTIPFHVSEKTN